MLLTMKLSGSLAYTLTELLCHLFRDKPEQVFYNEFCDYLIDLYVG
jgi:hypothetical protein